MREIKYKAWHKEKKHMYMVANLEFDSHGNLSLINLNTESIFTYWVKPEEVILLAYTGVKDIQKQKIYDGDIVLFNYYNEKLKDLINIAEVVVTEPLGLILRRKEKLYVPMLNGYRNFNIIGNIYENPGLIEARP